MRAKKTDYEKGVVDTLMKEANLMSLIPIETIGTMEVTTRRRNSVPTLNWRQRGQAYGSVPGATYDTITDSVFAVGGTVDIDKVDLKDKNLLEDPMSTRTKEVTDAMAWTLNDIILNGDHGVNPDAPEGIKTRLATLPTTQIIYGNSSSAELDVRISASPTTATMQQFLDKIDEARYACDGHDCDVVLTDASFIRNLKAVLRRLNLYKNEKPTEPFVKPSGVRSTGSEWYNKSVFEWDGIKFFDMGLNAAQTSTVVTTDTVNSVACMPAYFVKLGGDYLKLIQEYALDISKPFMLNDGVTWRTVIDWPVGIRHVHPRTMSVLRGVRVS